MSKAEHVKVNMKAEYSDRGCFFYIDVAILAWCGVIV